MYCSLNELFGLTMPVLSIKLSLCNFSGLLFLSTPRNLDVSEFVVGMKYCKGICQHEPTNRARILTECQYETRLLVQPQIILPKLFKAGGKGLLV